MALSNPRSYFGVHSVTPYKLDGTREYYGTLKVLGSSSLNFSGEVIPLNGGSSKFPYHVETGLITAELSVVTREYPDFMYEVLMGKAPTATAAESGGSVTAITNAKGTSLVNATTGVASITVESGQEADLKFTKYVAKVSSATDVDIYAATDIDFARGDDLTYVNDLLLVAASVTVPDTGGTVSIPNTGLEITGGSGTVAMTADDTATFESKPINSGSSDVVIGGASDTFPSWGAIILAKQRGNGQMVEFDMFSLIALGMPVGLTENAWSEASFTAQAFQDTTRGGVYSMRFVDAV